MRSRHLYLILLLLPKISFAVSETDFAYGYTLEVDGDGAIYSLPIPESIYRGLTRPDRGDLRVFNSQGKSVPHYIKRADQQIKQQQPDVNLPIFPLYNDTSKILTVDKPKIHIVTDDKGAIIDINYGKNEPESSRKIDAYLVDSSQLTKPPNSLLVNWQPGQTDFVINARVESSDDLNHWNTIVASTTLSDLSYEGHTLIQQRIDLPVRKQKYLRISWQKGKSLTLSSVMAHFPAEYQSQERQWSDFHATSTDDDKQIFYYDTHEVLPTDRISFTLPHHNTLVNVTLASAATKKGPWYPRYHGMLYDLKYEGNQLTTPTQTISVTTHRYWQLQILSKEAHLDGKPVLRLGWIPEQLYFIAQGEAPFTLAYGSARVGPVSTPLPRLLNINKVQNSQQLIKAAQLGSRIELGNRDKLKPLKPPADWKQVVLWLVLIIGVVALSTMALRLYKQMDQTGTNE